MNSLNKSTNPLTSINNSYCFNLIFIPDWNEVNKELASGMMDEDEYQMWLEDTLRLFNVQIDDYVYK